MVDKRSYVHTIFASISKRYDFLNSLLSLTFDQSWRKFAVSVSGLEPGCRVLDVCTGTGELALAYSKALFYPPPTPPKMGDYKTRVIGTDFCHEMLAIFKQKLEVKKLENVSSPIEADTLCLPFKDNSFDIVLATEVLEHLSRENGKQMLLEVERIATRQVLISTPLGKMNQPLDFIDNPLQIHKYIWDPEQRGV